MIFGLGLFIFQGLRKSPENVDQKSRTQHSESVGANPLPLSIPALPNLKNDPKEEAARTEAIQLTHQFIGLLLERKQMMELAKSSRSRQNHDLKDKLKESARTLEMELTELLHSSPGARQEFNQMVSLEHDPFVQRQLIGATKRLDPLYRAELAVELTKSESSETRKIGVETLPRTGTQQAFNQLSQISNQDSDVGVQTAAVKSLSRFGLEKNGGDVQPSEVSQTLRDLAKSQADPSVREAALRGLLGRGLLSNEDRDLIKALAQNETDPKIRDLAISSQKALSARGY